MRYLTGREKAEIEEAANLVKVVSLTTLLIYIIFVVTVDLGIYIGIVGFELKGEYLILINTIIVLSVILSIIPFWFLNGSRVYANNVIIMIEDYQLRDKIRLPYQYEAVALKRVGILNTILIIVFMCYFLVSLKIIAFLIFTVLLIVSLTIVININKIIKQLNDVVKIYEYLKLKQRIAQNRKY